jgi:hypothetical protein
MRQRADSTNQNIRTLPELHNKYRIEIEPNSTADRDRSRLILPAELEMVSRLKHCSDSYLRFLPAIAFELYCSPRCHFENRKLP